MEKDKKIGIAVIVVVIAVVAIISAYCIGQKSINSTVTNTPLATTSIQNPVQAQKDLLQLQNNCLNFAKIIEANNRFQPQHQIFTHYNTVLGKCFVEVTDQNYLGIDQYINDDIIFDAEKGTEIFSRMDTASGPGTFAQSAVDQRSTDGNFSSITITPEQFGKFRDQYMTN